MDQQRQPETHTQKQTNKDKPIQKQTNKDKRKPTHRNRPKKTTTNLSQKWTNRDSHTPLHRNRAKKKKTATNPYTETEQHRQPKPLQTNRSTKRATETGWQREDNSAYLMSKSRLSTVLASFLALANSNHTRVISSETTGIDCRPPVKHTHTQPCLFKISSQNTVLWLNW